MAQDNGQQQDGSGLRKQLEDALEENRTLKQQIRQRAYDDAGIPQGARDLFDSAYEGDLTVDALREFGEAKGFRLESLSGDPEGGAPEGQAPPAPDGEQRLQELNGAAMPPLDPSIDDDITKAQTEGDWDTFNRLSAQKLEAARR